MTRYSQNGLKYHYYEKCIYYSQNVSEFPQQSAPSKGVVGLPFLPCTYVSFYTVRQHSLIHLVIRGSVNGKYHCEIKTMTNNKTSQLYCNYFKPYISQGTDMNICLYPSTCIHKLSTFGWNSKCLVWFCRSNLASLNFEQDTCYCLKKVRKIFLLGVIK